MPDVTYPIQFYDDRYDTKTLEEEERSPPINPIIFDEGERTSNDTADDSYVPSFCRPSSPPHSQTPADIPNQPEALMPSSFVTAVAAPNHSLSQMIPTSDQCEPMKRTPPSRCISQPRPYDVAQELMSTRSLRTIGNALYFFDGKVYRFVDGPTMNRLIMGSCRKYVYAVGDASIIRRIYEVIQAEPNISVSRADDAVPLVALDDGLLDLTTLSLHPFSPAPFVTVKLNGNYTMGGASNCPTFDNFLAHIAGNDPILIERIWQSIGYCLVPDTNAKAFILLQGVPDSGKSLLGDVVASLIDQDLVTSLDISALGERFGPSELVGKQLCVALDMPSGALDAKAVSMFKSLTGGDFVTADVKYQNRIKFKCSASFLLATNHALLTRDQDTAFLRRAITIPFRYTVEKPQQDHTLKARILSERNAIIYRAIQAYSQLRANNYQFSGNFEPNDVVFSQGTSLANLTDILWGFCQEFCIPTADSFIPTSAVYKAFSTYSGYQWPGGIKSFSDSIFQIFSTLSPGKITRDRKRPKGTSENPERGFSGLALKPVSAKTAVPRWIL